MLLKIWPVVLLQHLCASEYIVCQLSDGTSCPRTVCLNTTLNFICNIETQQLGYTVWLLPNGTCLDKPYTDRISLLQPKYVGCNPSSSSQHGTCGPFSAQTVATSGCVNSSLSVVATQELDGVEIKCMNYNGRNYSLIGNTTLSVIGEPHPPNISVISGCTDIEVQWTSPPIEEQLTGVTISVKNEAGIVQSEGVPLPWNTNSIIFHNLMSDSYYYIIYQVSNCAGIDEVITPTWTLPRPPQGIQASHVINFTAHSMNLVVTWTNQLQPSFNRSYILNISFENSQIVKTLEIPMTYCSNATGVCYFTKVFSNITIVKCYISMASMSGPRIGPFSAQVESIASVNSLLTVFTSPSTFMTNVKCAFLDGQPYYCLVCCGSDPFTHSIRTMSNRGVVVGATLTNLTSNHTYYCTGFASTNSSDTCNQTNGSSTFSFSFKTNPKIPDIFLNSSWPVKASVLYRDAFKAEIICSFLDHLFHYCLICCGSNTTGNVSSTISNSTVTVDLYGLGTLYGTNAYCNASATNASKASCHTLYLSALEISLTSATCTPFSAIGTAVGVSVSVTFVISFSMGVLVASVLCYISRCPKQSSHKPSSHVDPATVYDEVGTNRKTKRDMEMSINESYFTLY